VSRGLVLAATLVLAAGCAKSSLPPNVGYDLESRPPPKGPPARAAKPPVPEDVVARAAAGVTALRLSDDAVLDAAAFGTELLKNDAICAGEEHDSAAQHFGELHLLSALGERAPNLGLELGLGLEMWEKRRQPLLTAFGRGKLGEEELLDRSDYAKTWGYPFAYYRPLLEKARGKGIAILGLNAPHQLTESVAKNGLDGLEPEEERELPALDLGNSEHFADFEQRMKHHPGVDHDSLGNFYAAQVVWDETMADTAATWLMRHAPMRRLLIVAGRAHCQRTAIPMRIERRGPAHVVAVWLGITRPSAEERQRYDYALIVGGSAPRS
jgi:uncharacterized iron-regulated protein